jgi:RIO kinase 1
MRTPESLVSLIDEGIIDEVVRPLMSGKEAQVYLVTSGGGYRVAKVYKDAQQRSFKQRADYTEGRTVRNSRDQRAMHKRTRYGRAQDEQAWRSAEVDMIYRLRAAGVRVPAPYHFIDGVLIMELVTDAQGNPAPRLGDLQLDGERASRIYERLIGEVVRMLAAGVVHGDLSDFNVLMGGDGPVIIDFPQSIEASNNQNARKLLLRDVDNLHRFLARFVVGRRPLPLAQEMWELYERGELTPETRLTGRYRASERKVVTDEVLSLVTEAASDERRRRQLAGGGRAPVQPRPGASAVQGPRGRGAAPRGPTPAPARPPGTVIPTEGTSPPRQPRANGPQAGVVTVQASTSAPRRRRRNRRRGGKARTAGPPEGA